MRPTVEQYAAQERVLAPRGPIWRAEPGSKLAQFLEGLAVLFRQVHARALDLLEEVDPRSTFELLTDWERVAGIPGPCLVLGETIQQRRAALVQRLTATGGASRAYFIGLAAALGYGAVTITEFNPFRVGDRVGSSVTGDTAQFVWQVNSPDAVAITSFAAGRSVAGEPLRAWGNDQLECVFNELKPAHTTVLFAYGS